MTGKDLIEWIENNKAEDLEVLIEHRDSGGTYRTAERLGEYIEPCLVEFDQEVNGTIYKIIYGSENSTAVLL